MSTTTGRSFTRALALAGALLLAVTLFSVTAPHAHAATGTGTSTTPAPAPAPAPKPKPPVKVKPFGTRVLATVATRKGSPYVYGASGPRKFDCSGLTMWTFKKLHRKLPHSAAAQYGRTKHVRARDRRIGDLVFFHDGGGIYHVGIYAGHNKVWHAPYSGTRVRKERIWTSAVYYGRIRS